MDLKLYDLKKLHEIARGDEKFVEGMLVTFMENVTTDIETVNAMRSVENWSAVAEKAHKLVSNFAYLNAGNLRKQASDIEKSVLNDGNLTGIADKTDKLCNDTILLIEQLKQNFDFLRKT